MALVAIWLKVYMTDRIKIAPCLLKVNENQEAAVFVRNELDKKQEVTLSPLRLKPFDECEINNHSIGSKLNQTIEINDILSKLNFDHLNMKETLAFVKEVEKFSDIFYIDI